MSSWPATASTKPGTTRAMKALPVSKADLTSFLKDLQSKKYNGTALPRSSSSPRSPAKARLSPRPPHATDCFALHRNHAERRETLDIPFVDLYSASRRLYQQDKQAAYTINGIHLTAEGYAKLAPPSSRSSSSPLPDEAPLDAIRTEVLEKNQTFFDWYRTVNSFYIHGDRKNPYGTVNFPLERQKLLQMTASRDQRIWSAARGETLPSRDRRLLHRPDPRHPARQTRRHLARPLSRRRTSPIRGRRGLSSRTLRLRARLPRTPQPCRHQLRRRGPSLGRDHALLPARPSRASGPTTRS